VTDYLARAMEQGGGEETGEAVAPELEEVHGGLFWKGTEEETGRTAVNPYEEKTADWTAETLDRRPGDGGMARRGRRAPQGVRGRDDESGVDVFTIGELGRPVSGPYEGYAIGRAVADVVGVSVSGRAVAEVPGVSVARGTERDSLPLLALVRKAQVGESFVRRERRAFCVTLPGTPGSASGFAAEELDRAVERDARRYDGGFPLY